MSILVGCLAAVLGGWALFAAGVALARPPGGVAGGSLRLLPDMVRLLGRLARDPSVPRSVRWRLWAALAYNLQPVNLIPDFVPVVGLIDNLVVTSWALRSALRAAGPDAVAHHWGGTPEGLVVLYGLVRLGPAPTGSGVRPPA